MVIHNVKRLPVVEEADRLKGIVGLSGLPRILLRRDDTIRDVITRNLLQRTLNLAPSDVRAVAHEGRVSLRGSVGGSNLVPIIERLCRTRRLTRPPRPPRSSAHTIEAIAEAIAPTSIRIRLQPPNTIRLAPATLN
jgi:CBS domain-containing protein